MTSETTPIPGLSPSKKERDATVEAVNHLIQGKRHLLVQDISSAVNSLQEACRILAACYGELANECADAYYHYGVSLLELSRKESGILGNEKEGSSCDESEEDEDDDDDDDDEEENDEESGDEKTTEENEQATDEVTPEKENEGGSNEAMREKVENDKAGEKVAEEGNKTDKGDPNASVMKEEETIAKDSEAKSEDLDDSRKADEEVVSENRSQPKSSNKTSADDDGCSSTVTASDVTCKPSTSKEDSQANMDPSLPGTSQDKGAGEDDVTTLQLSWEVLDLAKVIYKRQSADNREMQLRLAQVYLKLGEVAMESESYKQSIEDMTESCKILQEVLPSDDRAIAEVYYQLGLAYTFDLQYDVAIENFRGAIKVLKDRIANLEKVIAEKGDKDEDAVYNAKREVEEILELIPEISEKITDTEDLQKNSLKLPEELNKGLVPEKCQGEFNVPESSPVKEQKPVSSIAHLVRKKRKPEDVIVNKSESIETKRCRSEGDGDSEDTNSVPCINGTVETSTPPTVA